MRMANRPSNQRATPRRGFSLVELMVVVAVMSILLGLLMPGLARVRQTTYRMLSASNQRSLGQGFTLWAGSHNGKLPPSRLLFDDTPDLGELMRVYAPLTNEERGIGSGFNAAATLGQKLRRAPQPQALWHGWDGLGHLFSSGLIPEPTTFYAPAHWGSHPFERYENDWQRPGEEAAGPPDHVVYSNYHYCGHLDDRGRLASLERDADKILVTDGMRRQSDLTHRDGINILRASGSVEWMPDPTIMPKLPLETSREPISFSYHNRVIHEIFTNPWTKLGYWESAVH
jgi:prepilin-type N-terminal cleavage/methylation domain-containing protein